MRPVEAPVNPYGASKLMIERVLIDYARAYGLQFVALEIFQRRRRHPDAEVGELRDPETHLIPRAMMSIQGHLDDFEVFGSDYPTPDGTAIRDYIHVSDLADAHVAALRRLQDGKPGGAYNLGTGKGYSVREVLEVISRVETGEGLKDPVGLRREGDPAELVAEASLGRSELGWRPQLSDLKTIVATAWAWHQRAHPKTRPVNGLRAASLGSRRNAIETFVDLATCCHLRWSPRGSSCKLSQMRKITRPATVALAVVLVSSVAELQRPDPRRTCLDLRRGGRRRVADACGGRCSGICSQTGTSCAACEGVCGVPPRPYSATSKPEDD